MVLPVDKGRACVVLNTDTYHANISALIETAPLLNRDPTDCLTRKLTQPLLNLKRGGHISQAAYNMKISTQGNTEDL